SGGTQGLNANVAFDNPPHVGTVECTVTLTNANGTPARCTDIELEGNMNHAGMVPVFTSAEPRGEGTYVASMDFTMGGDWLIFVRGQSEEGHSFEIVKDVPGVRNKPQAGSTN
ncbi:MAG: FixH family protein, partial [Planctomycetes bacterium]|nr:FixH family protein [Planctomycetota bacterium]